MHILNVYFYLFFQDFLVQNNVFFKTVSCLLKLFCNFDTVLKLSILKELKYFVCCICSNFNWVVFLDGTFFAPVWYPHISGIPFHKWRNLTGCIGVHSTSMTNFTVSRLGFGLGKHIFFWISEIFWSIFRMIHRGNFLLIDKFMHGHRIKTLILAKSHLFFLLFGLIFLKHFISDISILEIKGTNDTIFLNEIENELSFE